MKQGSGIHKEKNFGFFKNRLLQRFGIWLPSVDCNLSLRIHPIWVELIEGMNWPWIGHWLLWMHQDLLLCAEQQLRRQEGLLTWCSWRDATCLLAFQQECNPWECGQPSPPEAGHTKPVRPPISSDKKMPVVRQRETGPCSLLRSSPCSLCHWLHHGLFLPHHCPQLLAHCLRCMEEHECQDTRRLLPPDSNYPQPCSSKELERGEISNAHTLGKIRVTEGRGPLFNNKACKRGSRHRRRRENRAPLEREVLGSSLSSITYLPYHIGNLSASKYLICKMGTSIMVLSTTAAWARDKAQSA